MGSCLLKVAAIHSNEAKAVVLREALESAQGWVKGQPWEERLGEGGLFREER